MAIDGFPMKLKRALVKHAAKEGSNMTNVAVAALAEHFKVKFVPTARSFSVPPGDSDDVSFAMPRKLRQRIHVAAANGDTTRKQIVIAVLTEKYLKKGSG